MKGSLRIYIGLLVLLFIGAIYLELSQPKPIDWRPTYNERHTSPYGLKILHEELNSLFDSVQNIKVTPYEFFIDTYDYENERYTETGTFFYVDPEYALDGASTTELLDYVWNGNQAFLSSTRFPEALQDSLLFDYRYEYIVEKEGAFTFANPALSSNGTTLTKGVDHMYFAELDSTTTTVLGYSEFDKEKHINFVAIEYGSGRFLLHTQPVAFTNYHLLKDDHFHYAEGVLSYLPERTLLFESQNKIGGNLGGSPLRYLFSQPALAWAWRFGLITLILFMIFNAKRRQRIIQVIEPLRNTTIAFTKTIGNLYFQTKDHNNIVQKKITYFLERIRNDLYLDTSSLDERFAKKLAKKWGYAEEKTLKLVNLIRYIQNKPQNSENDLMNLNKAIEAFYLKK